MNKINGIDRMNRMKRNEVRVRNEEWNEKMRRINRVGGKFRMKRLNRM